MGLQFEAIIPYRIDVESRIDAMGAEDKKIPRKEYERVRGSLNSAEEG